MKERQGNDQKKGGKHVKKRSTGSKGGKRRRGREVKLLGSGEVRGGSGECLVQELIMLS